MIFGSASARQQSFVIRGAAMGLTPLADIVFLLVIFFMLATSFSEREVADITLSPFERAGGEGDVLHMQILGEGIFLIEGETILRDRLPQALLARGAEQKKAGLHIKIAQAKNKGHRQDAKVQDLVDGFLAARRAGFSHISTESP